MKQTLIAFNAWFAGWETQFTPRALERLLRAAGLTVRRTLRRVDGARARVPRDARGAEARARVRAAARAARAPGGGSAAGTRCARRLAPPALGAHTCHVIGTVAEKPMTAAPHLLAVNFRDPGHPEAGGAELHLEEILLEAVRRGFARHVARGWLPGGAPESEHRGMRMRAPRHVVELQPGRARRAPARVLEPAARPRRRGHQQGAVLHAVVDAERRSR